MIDNPKTAPYQALARKYRPQNFDDIIGQEALVTTISNALKRNRMHHAFILTGVRGTGKTSTARIIARAVNCVGRDMTIDANPCNQCAECQTILKEASLDVVEIDAASHTGIDDVRTKIIETVQYRPVSGKFKIYIIDEVHMLSKNAFNAILKTLEEPPPYIKFIFATTELKKIPATILSRCQHFTLNRINQHQLTELFKKILAFENVTIDEESLMLIADIADGSVRDGLSLLDQAILIADGMQISSALISKMLRLNEQEQIYHLLDAIFQGDFPTAQAIIHALYGKGGEPAAIIRDLLSGCFWLTRFHLTPALKDDLSLSDLIRKQASDMAAKMDIQRLTRAWQILQQGASEISSSPVKLQSLEMLAVKLCYASNLPDPASLIQRFEARELPSAIMPEKAEQQDSDNVLENETETQMETETEKKNS